MSISKTVGIGIIGAGFLAETRARCYAKASGVDCRIIAVAEKDAEKGRAYAERHGIPHSVTDYRDLLALPEIDLVDLCVPNHLHRPMTEAAAAAGKHIACTKPLTAYVGQDLPAGAADEEVSGQSRSHMLDVVLDDAAAMVRAAEDAGVRLMYGENWIFSPSVQKAASLICESSGTILEMRGGECHSGSHTPFSKIWRYTGGGALIRLGAHPVGTMLYLKRLEGVLKNGAAVRPVTVTAEVGDLSKIASVAAEEHEWVARGWKDVENWGSAVISFDDGSKGLVWASDTLLGGMESRLEIFLSNCYIRCNLTPNNLVQAYAADPEVFAGEYIIEKGGTKAGWSTPMPDEDWTSGHWQMCQSFVRAVAGKEEPLADGRLGMEVARVIYAAYVSAAEGKRVEL